MYVHSLKNFKSKKISQQSKSEPSILAPSSEMINILIEINDEQMKVPITPPNTPEIKVEDHSIKIDELRLRRKESIDVINRTSGEPFQGNQIGVGSKGEPFQFKKKIPSHVAGSKGDPCPSIPEETTLPMSSSTPKTKSRATPRKPYRPGLSRTPQTKPPLVRKNIKDLN